MKYLLSVLRKQDGDKAITCVFGKSKKDDRHIKITFPCFWCYQQPLISPNSLKSRYGDNINRKKYDR